jgi:peptidoglycan/xylan/chitin deacetylase (PgdA/CDA1 family)
MHSPDSKPRSGLRPKAGLFLAAAAALGALILAGCAGQEAAGPAATKGPAVPPKNVSVIAGDGELAIAWDPQATATSYNLYWSLKPNPTPATATKIEGLSRPSYKQTGLTNGQEVFYLATAVGSTGEGKPTAFRAKPLKLSVLKFEHHVAVVVQPTDTFAQLAKRFLNDPTKGWMIQDYNELDALTPYVAVTVPLQPWKIGGLMAAEYQTVPLLTYHQFSTDGKANKMTVPSTNFEAQMQFLKDNDYRVITLDQFVDFLEFKAQIPDRAVVITDDDGWESFYQVAFPVLKKYGYPATIFIVTTFPESPDSNGMALTWPQVKEMAANGVDVECHTRTHRNLRMARDEDFKAYLASLEDEIKNVQAEMKKKAGITCKYLAYPYGARNPLVVALTQKYGFRAAFTVSRGANSFFAQDFLVRRSMIYGEYGLKEFERNLNVAAEIK